MTDDKSSSRFRRAFDRIERDVPGPVGRFFAALRTPGAMLVRIPLAILLVLGGIFSILPVLGLWMLPLGLLLLAVDVPFLRGPLAGAIVRARRWWRNRRQKRARR
ncbi:MAG: hypothetical protein KKH72_15125 [Alphaproteobacteria bacterium]|nr:hypothetical protein [Alphaproteobacteria bacterium]